MQIFKYVYKHTDVCKMSSSLMQNQNYPKWNALEGVTFPISLMWILICIVLMYMTVIYPQFTEAF